MFLLANIDMLTVGLVAITTGMLGFVVFFNNQKSSTNQAFLVFCLLTVGWGLVNYLNYQVQDPTLAIWMVRFVLFFAIWQAFSIFHFFYVIPEERKVFDRKYLFGLLPAVAVTSLLCLSPLVLREVVSVTSEGRISSIENGPGIAVFGTLAVGLVIGSLVILGKKIRNATPELQRPLKIILGGTAVTFTLIIIFNFLLPAFFANARFVPMGALFVFPFTLASSYAIFKHNILNTKVLSAEILVLFITCIMLLEVSYTPSNLNILLRLGTLLLIAGVGILLIRSVLLEVQQREELQKLTNELKEANEKLKALDIARAEFISIASHQLRTPPATIKWYLASILAGDYGPLTPDLESALKKTAYTNNGLISLVEDLLNVSRIERGTMEFLFEPTDIEEIVQAAFDQLLPIAREKKLDMAFLKPQRPLPVTTADKEKLRQVVNNLIDNAIKYTQQGSISVSLQADTQNITIRVKDNGKGLSSEDIKSIFQKYTRGKDSHHQSMGLGLGLYVAKIIIQQHNGKIWAESEGEGKGSVFVVELPIINHLETSSLLDLTKTEMAKI